jgi:nicotinamidase-related amidase
LTSAPPLNGESIRLMSGGALVRFQLRGLGRHLDYRRMVVCMCGQSVNRWVPNPDASDLLLVVDVQNGFVNDHSRHAVQSVVEFAGDWVAHGRHVVLTRFINPVDGPWERLMSWNKMRDSPAIDLVNGLPGAGRLVHVVDKGTYSAVTAPVQEIVEHLGANRILICGIDTDACVLKTAVDVFEQGHIPVVLSDLCASTGGQAFHAMGIDLITRFIGPDQVVRAEQIHQ